MTSSDTPTRMEGKVVTSRKAEILRWIAVFPAGVLAGVLVLFPLHWVLYSTLVKGSMIQMPLENMASVEEFLAPTFSSIAFVYAGALTAPRNRVLASYVLFAFSLFARLVMLLVAMQMKLDVDLSLSGVLKFLIASLAGAAGVFMVIVRESSHSPTVMGGSFQDERLNGDASKNDSPSLWSQVEPTEEFEEPLTPVEKSDSACSPLLIVVVVSLVILATNKATRDFVSFYALCVIINVVSVGGTILVCLMASAPIDKVVLFFGPHLAAVRVGDTDFSFSLIPFGSSVSFKEDDATDAPSEKRGLLRLPKSWRLSIHASGALALLLLSVLCIGSGEAWHHLTTGFYQVVAGALSPLSVGQELLQKIIDNLRSDFIVCLGLIAAKMVAFNLIPLPPLSGGLLIMELLRGLIEQSGRGERIQVGAAYVGVIVSLALLFGWFVAIVRFAFGSVTGI